jgi:predicted  nucleic acid-binding Zn-ribbon protein
MKKKDTPVDVKFNDRIDLLESRMDINRDMMEKMTIEFDSLKNNYKHNETKIIRIRSTKGQNNSLISNMYSSDMVKLLSERYKDSTKTR